MAREWESAAVQVLEYRETKTYVIKVRRFTVGPAPGLTHVIPAGQGLRTKGGRVMSLPWLCMPRHLHAASGAFMQPVSMHTVMCTSTISRRLALNRQPCSCGALPLVVWSGAPLLPQVEETLSQQLDDHLVMVQSMSFSPYKKPFEERLAKWEQHLSLVRVARSSIRRETSASVAVHQQPLPAGMACGVCVAVHAFYNHCRVTNDAAYGSGGLPQPYTVRRACGFWCAGAV
jgi:hypothetical protein